MSDVHRFVPQRSAARTEFVSGAVMAFIVVAGWLYIGRGERNPALILGLAVGAAALVLLSWFVRTRFQWVDEVQLSHEGVTLMRAGKPQTLPWTAVKAVKRYTRGGEQWVLSTRPGHIPMTIRSDGLSREDTTRLREMLPALHAAAQHTAQSVAR
jgi:hypothetical protein